MTASDFGMPGGLKSLAEPQYLPGLVAHWPAVIAAQKSEQDFHAYLSQFTVDDPVVVYCSQFDDEQKIGYRDDYRGFNFNRETSTLNSVLQRLRARDSRVLYIGSSRVDQWLPGFRAENDLAFDTVRPTINFWLGNQNQVAAHFDSPDNIACCVAGKRTFTLFPPAQIENLYIGPVDLTPSGRAISLVDFSNPDFKKFPKFQEALQQAITIELNPGDALFIPALWWHHVQSHAELNMLVNYWWRTSADYLGVPDLALEHALLALRGLPDYQRKAWKQLFDHYIFGDSVVATEHIPAHLHGQLDTANERAMRLAWLNFSKKMNS